MDLEEPVAAIVHIKRAGAGQDSRAAADAAMTAAAGSSNNPGLHAESEALLVFARSGRVVVLRPSRDFASLTPQRFRVLDSYLRLAAGGRAAAGAETVAGAAKLLVQVSVQHAEGCDQWPPVTSSSHGPTQCHCVVDWQSLLLSPLLLSTSLNPLAPNTYLSCRCRCCCCHTGAAASFQRHIGASLCHRHAGHAES